MKKYFPGLAAIILAVSISAFTTVPAVQLSANLVSYFWYTPDGLTSLGNGSLPNNGCHLSGTGCAKGYTSMPANPQTDPPDITVKN